MRFLRRFSPCLALIHSVFPHGLRFHHGEHLSPAVFVWGSLAMCRLYALPMILVILLTMLGRALLWRRFCSALAWWFYPWRWWPFLYNLPWWSFYLEGAILLLLLYSIHWLLLHHSHLHLPCVKVPCMASHLSSFSDVCFFWCLSIRCFSLS